MPQSNGLCASFVLMRDSNAPLEIEKLESCLQPNVLPGWEVQALACPPGRPPDVAEKMAAAKRAGVMCLLCPNHEGRWSVVVMKRTEDGTTHSGQLAFPGGAEEPADEGDLMQTALRECAEEVGVKVPPQRVLGVLSSVYIPPSDFFVQPYVAWSPKPLSFELQVEEVAEILVLPLDTLPLPQTPWPLQRMTVGRGTIRVPGWPCQGQVLWGATAMMMAELRAVCHLAGFGPSFASS